ncbi:MAG: tRNA (adenosine(37)-N6)-dimethylallyltransferase MiaA [Ignavibacterium sp.]|nr:MAG: tRNA (adenosine(37)-N6)-dimethylallyltransferase MiaA [Ignavibacterium sp.]
MGQRVIVITGPTCSGKSYLSLKTALFLNTEIISADSRQVYKNLNIGTAKPSQHDLKEIKHHLINILNPDEVYNASSFSIDAERVITKLLSEEKTPIVSGGTGLYIKALIDGIAESADKDEEIREQLLEKKKHFGFEHLYEELKNIDPISASKILPQNWKRVIRALEVFYVTGKPIWEHHNSQKPKIDFDYFQVGLLWNRNELYKNINDRVDDMIEDGLVKEVKEILNEGYDKSLNSLNTVGYKEIISYLNDEISFDRAIELIKRNTRHYAKRQMTWFNADKRINWYQISSKKDLDDLALQLRNN